ncbi:porin [Phreatobacter aquaticus]|uniref:Porin n=1 Tax=Phreatobacter aquaticus TaxID=2570229 RepID=A0A4D7QR77_9HYPH|nr:porin [Phreatobacter aquaticus]QCK87754.1 porin [Phreatobacter aquaticus]
MKTVKSLLLGTAAGFAAIAGAQAADLPGKAAPAEYVRICDTYGAGFFFIPGTDTCLRIGGYVRADYTVYLNHTSNTLSNGAVNISNGAFDNTSAFQSRFGINFDARSNTEYGLLRSFAQFTIRRGESSGYMGSGLNAGNNNPRSTLAIMDRAFIQFAGFTFGYSASFFNFYQGDVNLLGNPTTARATSTNLLAYTASFGSGFSATLSIEDRRIAEVGNLDTFTTAAGQTISLGSRPLSTVNGLTYGRQDVPDIVANLRVDQGWGSAQLMGAFRQIKDYGYAGTTSATNGAISPTAAAGDKWGFAIGAGLRLNLDMITRGDQFWLQATYTDGALGYLINNSNGDGVTSNRNNTSGPFNFSQGGGLVMNYRDAIVNTAAGNVIQTTKAWGVAAGFRHFWTPNLRSSLFGTYASVDAPLASTTLPDFKLWTVGANIVWSPVRNLDLGLEVVYGSISRSGVNSGTATQAANATCNSNGSAVVASTLACKTSDQNLYTTLRVQRNF